MSATGVKLRPIGNTTVHYRTLVRVGRWVATVGWMAVIFAMSSIEDLSVPSGLATPGHAILYAILGALLAGSLGLEGGVRSLTMAILVASAYGVTDEVHQAFVPTRHPDVLDWAWDTIGATIGAALTLLMARWLEQTSSRSRSRRPADP